jgi:hypothetical protein
VTINAERLCATCGRPVEDHDRAIVARWCNALAQARPTANVRDEYLALNDYDASAEADERDSANW